MDCIPLSEYMRQIAVGDWQNGYLIVIPVLVNGRGPYNFAVETQVPAGGKVPMVEQRRWRRRLSTGSG
jgi:hypothetical protein